MFKYSHINSLSQEFHNIVDKLHCAEPDQTSFQEQSDQGLHCFRHNVISISIFKPCLPEL